MVSMATHYASLKNGVYLQKYSYLSSNSSYNTKFGTKLILRHIYNFYLIVGYANYLIFIFIDVNENIRNKRKIVNKLRGVPTKLPLSQLLIVLVYQT